MTRDVSHQKGLSPTAVSPSPWSHPASWDPISLVLHPKLSGCRPSLTPKACMGAPSPQPSPVPDPKCVWGCSAWPHPAGEQPGGPTARVPKPPAQPCLEQELPLVGAEQGAGRSPRPHGWGGRGTRVSEHRAARCGCSRSRRAGGGRTHPRKAAITPGGRGNRERLGGMTPKPREE